MLAHRCSPAPSLEPIYKDHNENVLARGDKIETLSKSSINETQKSAAGHDNEVQTLIICSNSAGARASERTFGCLPVLLRRGTLGGGHQQTHLPAGVCFVVYKHFDF